MEAVSFGTLPPRFPIASPDNTNSTRRFCLRPSGVSLEATGAVFPKPLAEMASDGRKQNRRVELVLSGDAIGNLGGNVPNETASTQNR